jgi:hypothetical protein
MKKQLLVFVCWIAYAANSFAQSEKFDIATFIPPHGWQRIDTLGTVAFFHSKTANGLTSFCQIILYPSSNSSRNADKDFKAAWNNLVAVPAKTKARPVTQKEKTPEGWTVVTGATNITNQGLNYNSIVTTITGFGKTMNVQVNLAGNDYADIIEKFFKDLELDSKATVVKNNQQNNRNTNDQSMINKPISINDYDFITPEGWQVQNNKDYLHIQNMESGCFIRISPPQASSGDLEKDASAVFDVMYQGWQYQKSGSQKFMLSKGFLLKGLEYCRKEATMSITDASGRYNLEEGAAMVVKAGNQIVIISIRHNSSLFAHDDCWRKYSTVKRFFNSFTVKNAAVSKNVDDASSRIIGAWSQTESGASSEYVFAANGNYALIGALGSKHTTSDYRYEYLHIKTYAFQGDGSYSISGDQLILKQHNKPESVRFRFEKVNTGGTGWKDRLCMLKTDGFGENEVCYEKQQK